MIISPQDTVKKKSPVMVNERAGFDESEPAVKETTDTKKTDKRSPFGVANAEPNSKKEKKEKNKVEKQTTASSNKETTNKKTQAAEPRIIQAPKAIVAPFETTRVFTAPAIEPKKIISTVPKDTIATAEKRTINQHYLAPKYRKYINQDGLFILFLVIGGLFGWINMFHRKRFIQVLNAFFVTRIVNQLIREENTLLQRV
ncbi:MAG: hypothetical protein IT239_03115, partial [Bacteroidia bacterium]|nr:hypothetical protein [Bacteroidia bacterium]